MAQKKITLFKEGYNIGAQITDGDNTIKWYDLTTDEQLDLIDCMVQMALFFNKYVKEE